MGLAKEILRHFGDVSLASLGHDACVISHSFRRRLCYVVFSGASFVKNDQVNVTLPLCKVEWSGRSEALALPESATTRDPKIQAQQVLGRGFLELVTD